VAAKYDGSRTHGTVGRPPACGAKVAQLLTMARENPSWGYTRLRGALKNPGVDIGRSTIQRILSEHGLEPAPLRGKTMPWKTFLKVHWGAIAAADFFSVEVLTRGAGVVREFVEHDHSERNHQGLGNVIPFPSRGSAAPAGPILRRERLGGLLHVYERKAA
jgi:hypothetical protein